MDSGWKVRSRNLKGPCYANVTSPAVLPEKPHWLRPVSFVYYSKHVLGNWGGFKLAACRLLTSTEIFKLFILHFFVDCISCGKHTLCGEFLNSINTLGVYCFCKIDQLKTSSVLKERWKPRLSHAFFIFRSATISHTLWHLRSTALVEMVHGSRRTDEDGGRPLRWLSE